MFSLHGLYCPFLWACGPWASSAHLLALYSHGLLFTNLIGLPWPNLLILILGVHGLAINPYFLYIALGLPRPILTFSYHTLPMGVISLFPGPLGPFASSRPICSCYGPVFCYSCRSGLIVLFCSCRYYCLLYWVGLTLRK